MKLQIVNRQSKLVRRLPAICVAGPYGGIANPLYATRYTLYALFIFALLAAFCAQTTFADGSIVSWGYNDYGQCNIPSPNSGFIAISAGSYHSLGLKQDGSIVAWGYNGNGQCNIPSPNSGFIAIAAGGVHSLGLKQDGSIVAWGRNNYGQCNIPSPNSGFIAIAAGFYHSLSLKQDGSIVAWGKNTYGQCDIPSPNSGFIAISAGSSHSFGLKQDGSIVAWGYNYYGQCNIPSPNSGFIAIAAGFYHSLGLKQDGSIVAWGYYGLCDIPSPNSGFIAISAGETHSLGLKQDGSIVAWGSNYYGQCNIPSPNTDFIAISAGLWHSLALKKTVSEPEWSFVQISDPHIGSGAGSNYDYDGAGWNDDGSGSQEHLRTKLLQSLVEEINAKKNAYNIKFAVCTGDLTDTAEWSEFIKVKEILNNLTVPWIPLLGNHDVWPTATIINKAPEVDADNYGADQYFYDAFGEVYTNFENELNAAPGWNWWKNDTEVWNPSTTPQHYCYPENFWFDYSGYHFVGLDFCHRDNDIPAAWNLFYPFGSQPQGNLHDFDGGTWQWFEDHLTSYIGSHPQGGKNVILLSHHPFRQVWELANIIGFLPENIKQEMASLNIGFCSDDLTKVETFLDSHKDRIWCQFAGHSHRNQETKIGTIPIIETGSVVIRKVPGPMGFIIDVGLPPMARIVTISSDSTMNNYNEILLGKSMTILGLCPIDLEVTDPNGRAINKEISEIPGAWYLEEDIDHDGNLDRIVFIPERISGDYQIRVIPQPDANSTDTYSLIINTAEGSSGQVSTVLAQDVPISEIPTEPYILGAGELIDTQLTYTGALQGYDGETVNLEVALTDTNAIPISDQNITFRIGTQSTSAITDVNGIALCTLKLQQAPSEFYFVEVSFAGTENYKPVAVSEPFAILASAPTVGVISPKANQVIQDGVTLTAEANDASGVAAVYFCVREPNSGSGVPIGKENLAGTFNSANGKWECNFDTAQLQDGSYVVLAKAVDIYNNVGWSEVVPFSIRNWAIIPMLPSTPNSKAGRTMPVKFSLRIAKSVNPAMPFVYNDELEIRIYDKAKPSVILQRSVFGSGSRDYRIDMTAKMYITNFKTGTKPATYVVEVWRPEKNFKVGSFTFKTVK